MIYNFSYSFCRIFVKGFERDSTDFDSNKRRGFDDLSALFY